MALFAQGLDEDKEDNNDSTSNGSDANGSDAGSESSDGDELEDDMEGKFTNRYQIMHEVMYSLRICFHGN